MVEKAYSAGLVSQSFWFVEMKKVIKLIDSGKNEEDIKKCSSSTRIYFIFSNHIWINRKIITCGKGIN